MTPWDVFKNLCGIIFTGESRNVLASRKDFVFLEELVSTSRSSYRNLLIDFRFSTYVPCIANGDNKGGSVPVRHSAYLEYTQNIMLQHQGGDPTGKSATPYLQH
ncbi:hypothetical protein TNCV_1757551 [Trichonephila clavipes]|nr:hypothetical protein TNCV_1757551 [Trichonephila clavipes]